MPRYTIIDEADEMVSTDWLEDMTKIMGGGGMFDSSEDMTKTNDFQIQTKTQTIFT